MENSKSKELITKSNNLIEARLNFSLMEYRIILYSVSLINTVSTDLPDAFEINIKNFAQAFEIDVNGLYSDIKQTLMTKFFNRRFTILLDDGKKKVCHWLDSVVYEDHSGYIELKFSNDIVPFLQNLKTRYTTYYFEKITKFKSVFSVRIYEYCIMEINKKNSDYCVLSAIVLDELKLMLGLNDKYNLYAHFKQRVLNKASEEINAYSDLTIDFEEIKKGRAVEAIKFTVKRKNGCKRAKYEAEIEQQLQAESYININQEIDLEAQAMKARLIKNYLVNEKIAESLVDAYPVESIQENLNYVDHVKIEHVKDLGAYTANAIKEDYKLKR